MTRYMVAFKIDKPDRDAAEAWAQWVAGYETVATPVEIWAITDLDADLEDADLEDAT